MPKNINGDLRDETGKVIGHYEGTQLSDEELKAATAQMAKVVNNLPPERPRAMPFGDHITMNGAEVWTDFDGKVLSVQFVADADFTRANDFVKKVVDALSANPL